ncbi:hypothetical protein G6F68_016541 [Rhizopus microsporus]|nr:hypothetical protein G6F68_016541 [Rhizopus microsporus]
MGLSDGAGGVCRNGGRSDAVDAPCVCRAADGRPGQDLPLAQVAGGDRRGGRRSALVVDKGAQVGGRMGLDCASSEGGRPQVEGMEAFVRQQRRLAETMGEWGFYALIILVLIALVQRVSTHGLSGVPASIYLFRKLHSETAIRRRY